MLVFSAARSASRMAIMCICVLSAFRINAATLKSRWIRCLASDTNPALEHVTANPQLLALTPQRISWWRALLRPPSDLLVFLPGSATSCEAYSELLLLAGEELHVLCLPYDVRICTVDTPLEAYNGSFCGVDGNNLVARLVAALRFLSAWREPSFGQFLVAAETGDGDAQWSPLWERIRFGGQSLGANVAGLAALLQPLARVTLLSGMCSPEFFWGSDPTATAGWPAARTLGDRVFAVANPPGWDGICYPVHETIASWRRLHMAPPQPPKTLIDATAGSVARALLPAPVAATTHADTTHAGTTHAGTTHAGTADDAVMAAPHGLLARFVPDFCNRCLACGITTDACDETTPPPLECPCGPLDPVTRRTLMTSLALITGRDDACPPPCDTIPLGMALHWSLAMDSTLFAPQHNDRDEDRDADEDAAERAATKWAERRSMWRHLFGLRDQSKSEAW